MAMMEGDDLVERALGERTRFPQVTDKAVNVGSLRNFDREFRQFFEEGHGHVRFRSGW